LRLIIEQKSISTKYSKEVLDFYDDFTSINFDNVRYEDKFEIEFKDKTKKRITNRKELNNLFFKNSENRKYK
jgi:hypothetical protein